MRTILIAAMLVASGSAWGQQPGDKAMVTIMSYSYRGDQPIAHLSDGTEALVGYQVLPGMTTGHSNVTPAYTFEDVQELKRLNPLWNVHPNPSEALEQQAKEGK